MQETAVLKAIAAWGSPLPDWIRALADECDTTSQRTAAKKAGVSAASVNLALNKKKGSRSETGKGYGFVKEKVENSLMLTMLPCPELGVIEKAECLEAQHRPFNANNQARARLYKACNACKYREGK